MKIAIISDHIPYPAAHSINIMKHSEGFFRLDYDVEVLTVKRLKEKLYLLKIGDIHDFYDINRQIKIKSFRDYSFLYFRGIKFVKNYFYILNILFEKFLPNIHTILNPEKKISEYCKKNNIDLIYCRRTYKAAIYNIFNKIPTIIETHNFNIQDPYLKKLLSLSKNKYFKGLITISDELKKRFVKMGIPKEKIIVLEDAVDLSKFDSVNEHKIVLRRKLNLPLNKKIILHLGNLSDGRGIDTLLDATKFLDNLNLAFYFVGGTKKRIRSWKKYKINRKIKSEIIFLGFLQHKQVPLYLKSADILIAPYTSECKTAEWMSPIKIFEYMASKVPFIASNLKRIVEICGNDNCLIFKEKDPKDLSEKIITLINDTQLQNKLIYNAYRNVKKNTYLERCKAIISFIK